MHSLRSKLLINTACITTAVFVCVAIVLFGLIRRKLWVEFDSLLTARIQALAAMIEHEGGRIDIDFETHPLPEFARQVRPEYYEVWSDDGAVLARSRHLGARDLDRLRGSLVEPGIAFTTLPDGRQGRCATVQFLPRVEADVLAESRAQADPDDDNDDDDGILNGEEPAHVTLVIARDTAEVDDALNMLAWTLAGVLLGAVLMMIGALGWIVTRNLRPLGVLASQIGSTDADSLSSRFSLDEAPAELQPIVDRLNELLARIEDSFLRERTFSANVAHELRTPLAGMRATLDVALSRPRESLQYRESLQACQLICEQTQQLVCALLEMARLESGQGALDLELVCAALVLEKTWEPYFARAEERQVAVICNCHPEILLKTDAGLLQLLFTNLVDNAVTYVDVGGWISIDVDFQEDCLQVVFANSGCRLTRAQASRVFERFWRGDVARAETGTRAGLGLAICQRIASVVGATIDVDVTDAVFAVAVGFPPECVAMATPEGTESAPVGMAPQAMGVMSASDRRVSLAGM